MPPIPPIAAALAILTLIQHSRRIQASRRRAPDLTNPAVDRAIRALLVTLAVTVLTTWPPAYAAIDHQLDTPNLAILIQSLCGITSALCSQVLMLQALDPARARRRLRLRAALAATVAVTLTAVFFVAHFTVDAPSNFLDRYTGQPATWAFVLTFLAFIGAAAVDVFQLCIRYAKTAATRAVAIVARLLATSCIVALTYVTIRTILVINAEPRTPVAGPDLAVSQLLISISICIIVASLALPAFAAPLLRPARMPSRSHQYRQLHPLWLALYQAMPEIALQPPRRPERNFTRPATTHAWSLLYRRLIEIHDGLRRLQPYLDPSLRTTVAQQAIDAGAPPDEAAAAGTAAAIADALQQLTAGEQPEFTGTPLLTKPQTSIDVDREAAWLVPVSRALPPATDRAQLRPTR